MKLTKKQQKELQKLTDELTREAKSVRLDYEKKSIKNEWFYTSCTRK